MLVIWELLASWSDFLDPENILSNVMSVKKKKWWEGLEEEQEELELVGYMRTLMQSKEEQTRTLLVFLTGHSFEFVIKAETDITKPLSHLKNI